MAILLYKAVGDFNKKVPKFIKNKIENEYFRLRHYACNAINPHFKEWNEEFGDVEPFEGDPLKDYGGTEYCKFIRRKEREIIKQVNKEHKSWIIKLDIDEIGDIIARTRIGGVVMTMEFEPYYEES